MEFSCARKVNYVLQSADNIASENTKKSYRNDKLHLHWLHKMSLSNKQYR